MVCKFTFFNQMLRHRLQKLATL